MGTRSSLSGARLAHDLQCVGEAGGLARPGSGWFGCCSAGWWKTTAPAWAIVSYCQVLQHAHTIHLPLHNRRCRRRGTTIAKGHPIHMHQLLIALVSGIGPALLKLCPLWL